MGHGEQSPSRRCPMAAPAARAKSLFLAAADLADPAARAAYLERECGGDAELRARVEALLRANDAAPLPAAEGATVDSAPGQPETEGHADPTARVGAILAGKYKLVGRVGSAPGQPKDRRGRPAGGRAGRPPSAAGGRGAGPAGRRVRRRRPG